MLKVTDLNFSYGGIPLYEHVNFLVGRGQKVGLVGPNGSGKSTLLKILTKGEEGYTGRIDVTGRVAMVPQEIKHDPIMESSESIRDYVDPMNDYQDFEINKLFNGLELEVEFDGKAQTLSGGQKTKLALARALLAKPDILLLDEPTNFMDIQGKAWVMNFLGNYNGTVIVISHDLELMDHSIDKILAVNPGQRSVEEYKGNYSAHLRLKKEKDELLRKEIQVKQQHIARMEKGLRRMSGPGVLKIKQVHRIEKARENLPELPPEVRKIKISLPDPANVGELPIKAVGLTKSYGEHKILVNTNFTIIRGERIALIGPNGAGKSTFIKILMGMIDADSGEVVRNDQLRIGYYSQEFETFDFNKSVIDTFIDKTEKNEGFARSFLGRYMFVGDKIFQSVESLSGGEKTRLSIAMITGVDNNLLILDEPTTYLDVMSQRIILESLKEYKGTMIIVSHTPEFIKELRPDKAYLFPENKMVFWDDELLDKVEEI